jgi:predicted permease
LNTIVSIFGIYAFILLGWVAKKIFKEQIDEKSLVLISIYFLSPILVFWGLTTQKIDTTAIKAPFIFFVVTVLALAISLVFANFLFKDKKDRSIATVASIVGNTGNLGIPLGIALFGEASVLYTSIINLVNIFIINTVGVFFYARGEFSTKEAFLKIFALPAIWFGVFGILFNLSNLTIPSSITLSLQMGAYANMVIQLFIFGMYLYGVKTKEIDFRLFTFVSVLKFIITPILALYILSLFTLEDVIYNVILLELLVPLAVTNVNLSALYNCKVNQVAFLVFSTSVIFLGYIFLVLGMFR